MKKDKERHFQLTLVAIVAIVAITIITTTLASGPRTGHAFQTMESESMASLREQTETRSCIVGCVEIAQHCPDMDCYDINDQPIPCDCDSQVRECLRGCFSNPTLH